MAAFLCQHSENALRAAILTRRSDGRRVGRHARDIVVVVAGRVGRRERRAFRGRRVDHQCEALLGGRQLGNVVVRMRTPDVLLHRAVPLLLCTIESALPFPSLYAVNLVSKAGRQAQPSRRTRHREGSDVCWDVRLAGKERLGCSLTPRHRLRQAEPSWFFSGQTTSFCASDTEKELVSELRGGIFVAENRT